MDIDKLKKRYAALCHAMQSGVAGEMIYDKKSIEPKHLRVGINSTLVSNHALVTLLIKKGIISEQEFLEQLVDSMFSEVKRYEELLGEKTGKKVTLYIKTKS